MSKLFIAMIAGGACTLVGWLLLVAFASFCCDSALQRLRRQLGGEKDERYQRTVAGLAIRCRKAHGHHMLDFNAAAELYFGRPGVHARKMTGYRRFASAAAAVLFAVEHLAPAQLDHALLEVDENRFAAADIRLLYASADFPLARKAAQ